MGVNREDNSMYGVKEIGKYNVDYEGLSYDGKFLIKWLSFLSLMEIRNYLGKGFILEIILGQIDFILYHR